MRANRYRLFTKMFHRVIDGSIPLFALKGQPDISPGQSETAKPVSAVLGLVSPERLSPERATQLPCDVSPFQGEEGRRTLLASGFVTSGHHVANAT